MEYTMEKIVTQHRAEIVRCIKEPTIVSYLEATILSSDDAIKLRTECQQHPIRWMEHLLDLVLKSQVPGKLRALLEALKKAGYPYLVRLLQQEPVERDEGYIERIGIHRARLEEELSGDLHNAIVCLERDKVISTIDRAEVESHCTNKGNRHAVGLLLDRMQCRLSPQQWYYHFCRVLLELHRESLLKDLDPDFLANPSQFLSSKAPAECEMEMDVCLEKEAQCSSVREHLLTDHVEADESRNNLSGVPPQPETWSDSPGSSSLPADKDYTYQKVSNIEDNLCPLNIKPEISKPLLEKDPSLTQIKGEGHDPSMMNVKTEVKEEPADSEDENSESDPFDSDYEDCGVCDSSMDCEESGGACGYTVKEHFMSDYEKAPMPNDNMDPPPAPPYRSDSLVSSSIGSGYLDHSPDKKVKIEVKEEPDSDSDDSNSLASDGEGASNLELRSYQLELAERAIKGENTIICAPTGSGKTWVALHIAEKHLQTFTDRPNRKIVFMARTGTLIQQQADMFSKYLPQLQIKLLQGDSEEAGMLGEFLPDSDVLCLTPQILVNNLDCGSVKSLTQFSLLIFDECHHTRGDEPYSVLMRKYLVEKYDDTRDEKLPQIVGLTASIGIGKSSSDVEARDYILRVCALMDVKRLSIVKTCKKELRKYTSEPEEEIIKMSRLRDDPGRDILLTVIDETEDKLKDLAFLQPSMVELVQRKCPKNKESQEYNKWAVDVMNAAHLSICDPDTSRNIRTCANYLNVYNQALEVNSLLQKIDVMKFLADKHTSDCQQKEKLTDFERELLKSLQDVQRKLGSVERETENPNVRNLSRMLSDMLENGGNESRAMVFVKARATCKALAVFLNDDLQDIEVRPLFGKDNRGNEEGMTQALQNETIQMFREGEYKVLVATSIGGEGIDIPSCNMVLTYNYTGNEITKIQMKGRIRKHGGRNVIIGDVNMVERERVNAYKVAIMQRAVGLYDALALKVIENKTSILQKEEMRKYKMKIELEKAKKRKQTNKGDYEIRCKRCDEFACYFSDIRKMEPHHIVVEMEFANRVVMRPVKPPVKFDGFVNNYKIFCKKCPQEWGVLAEKDGFDCRILKIAKLKFKNRETSRIEPFKRWIDIPVSVPDMTDEDLPRLFGQNTDN